VEDLIQSDTRKRNWLLEKDYITKNSSGMYRSQAEIDRALHNLVRWHVIQDFKAELALAEKLKNPKHVELVKETISRLEHEIQSTGKIVYIPVPYNPEPGKRYWYIDLGCNS